MALFNCTESLLNTNSVATCLWELNFLNKHFDMFFVHSHAIMQIKKTPKLAQRKEYARIMFIVINYTPVLGARAGESRSEARGNRSFGAP